MAFVGMQVSAIFIHDEYHVFLSCSWGKTGCLLTIDFQILSRMFMIINY